MALRQLPTEGFTLLNGPSGTSLTGASTITVGNLGGYNRYFLYIAVASSANLSATIRLRINEDSGLKYNYALNGIVGTAAGNVNNFLDSAYSFGRMGNVATDSVTAYIMIDGATAAGIMPIMSSSGATGVTTNSSYSGMGFYSASAPLSSISLVTSAGNFDAGTVSIYGQRD